MVSSSLLKYNRANATESRLLVIKTMGTVVAAALVCTGARPSRRRMKCNKCVCPAITLATIVAATLLVNLVSLSGFYPHTPSLPNRREVMSSSRLILRELPKTISRLQKRATLSIYSKEEEDKEIDFTDPQFVGTVEEEYDRLSSSVRWLRQRVEWAENDLEKAPQEVDNSQHLTVTIFSAPSAIAESEIDFNRQALLSWLHLSPRPRVVLLGNHSSLHQVAEEFPGMVSVEASIDYSLNGLPLFNSMVARAHAADTNVTVLIQPNVILLQDFMPGIRKIAGAFDDWVLVSRQLAMRELPFKFVHKGGGIIFLEHSITGDSMIDRELASYVGSSGRLEVLDGVDMWAWNLGNGKDDPLFPSPMPPFTYGAGYHDQWMARGFAKGMRAVVDSTDALVGFHVLQPPPFRPAIPMLPVARIRKSSSVEEWQSIANLYLYRSQRDFWAEERELLSGGWKLIACQDPVTIQLCVSSSRSDAVPCRCGSDSWEDDPFVGTQYSETFLEKEGRMRLEVIRSPAIGTGPDFSHDLDQLLTRVVDVHNNIVLVGVSVEYKEFLMSFMCRARSLGVNNILVAAFDKETYKFAFLQGLPVFKVARKAKPTSNNNDAGSNNNSCNPRSTCLQELLIMKLQAVLQILHKGYNVLWSDLDVVWFKNPLPYLQSFGPDMFPVQVDEPNMNRPSNRHGTVNSGFFYAQAVTRVIETFKEILKQLRARTPTDVEDQIFNRVLCGNRGQLRVDSTECKTANGLRTIFLDRHTFPNGIVDGYWWHPNVIQVCVSNGVYVLHNNWIDGLESKVIRQKAKQVWFYDEVGGMCVQPWQHKLGHKNYSQPLGE